MKLNLDLQLATELTDLPSPEQFENWLRLALEGQRDQAEVTIRLVDEAESRTLNAEYRGKDKPTNVLSFPFEAPSGIELDLLGDLVICAPLVRTEAEQQHKQLQDHWTHLVIHGTLHLLGYDHETEPEAQQMEALETRLLARIGIPDPYHIT